MKDRNAIVSAASKKSNRSNNNSGTLTTPKFNQNKNAATSHEANVGGGGSGSKVKRERNAKNRRNAQSYNPDNNKKSHLPFDAKNVDHRDGDGEGGSRKSNGKNGSGTNRRKLDANENVNVDNVEIDGDDSDSDDENIGFASFSATKSNLSHMTWRTDNQRISKRQSVHQNINYDANDDADDNGSASHKTNRRDATKMDLRHQKIASSFDSLSSPSTITSVANEMLFSYDSDNNHSRNVKHIDGRTASIKKLPTPNVAYLRSSGGGSGDVDSRVTSSNMMLVNNNNHLNNNNAIVETFDAPPTAMELECVAGYDGGLPQYFLLEAYDSRTKKLRLNITSAYSDVPLFRIDLTGTSSFSRKYSKIIKTIFFRVDSFVIVARPSTFNSRDVF